MLTEQDLDEIEARANAATVAEFIIHARSDVPKLVAEVRRLQEELDRLENSLVTASHYADDKS